MQYLTKTVIGIAIIQFMSFTKTTKSYEIDLKDPKSVVNTVFYAAQTDDYNALKGLCDPMGEGDGDTRNICSIGELADQIKAYGGSESTIKKVNEFKKVFESGRVSGLITYEETDGVKYAEVPILITNPQTEKEMDESFTLVSRYGNWYLYSI